MNRKNSIISLPEPKKCWISCDVYTYEPLKFHAQLSWAWKKFYNLRAWLDTIISHSNKSRENQTAKDHYDNIFVKRYNNVSNILKEF